MMKLPRREFVIRGSAEALQPVGRHPRTGEVGMNQWRLT
jgi:hypothetical protein